MPELQAGFGARTPAVQLLRSWQPRREIGIFPLRRVRGVTTAAGRFCTKGTTHAAERNFPPRLSDRTGDVDKRPVGSHPGSDRQASAQAGLSQSTGRRRITPSMAGRRQGGPIRPQGLLHAPPGESERRAVVSRRPLRVRRKGFLLFPSRAANQRQDPKRQGPRSTSPAPVRRPWPQLLED